MEIYIVTTTHSVPEDELLHADVAVFTDEGEARKYFSEGRIRCIKMLREEFEDTDEETRDVSVRDFDDMMIGVCHDDGEMYQLCFVKKSLQQP